MSLFTDVKEYRTDSFLSNKSLDAPSAADRDQAMEFCRVYSSLLSEMNRGMVNRTNEIKFGLYALFAGGHISITGDTGTGKTRYCRMLAEATGLETGRIQMTPSMQEADFTGYIGGKVINGTYKDEFHKGPLFKNIVQIDEANRTPAKAQSGLLEALEEQQVTLEGQTHKLPDPHMIVAAKNPYDGKGTYEIIDALEDRYMVSLEFGLPSADDYLNIAEMNTGVSQISIKPIFNHETGPQKIIDIKKLVRSVQLTSSVIPLARDLMLLLRPLSRKGELHHDTQDIFSDEENKAKEIANLVSRNPSVRPFEDLLLMTKVRALTDGRVAATKEDLLEIAKPVVRHRFTESRIAATNGITTDDILDNALDFLSTRYADALRS